MSNCLPESVTSTELAVASRLPAVGIGLTLTGFAGFAVGPCACKPARRPCALALSRDSICLAPDLRVVEKGTGEGVDDIVCLSENV